MMIFDTHTHLNVSAFTGEEKEAPHFLAEKIYVSPILIADKDGFHWDKTMYDT